MAHYRQFFVVVAVLAVSIAAVPAQDDHATAKRKRIQKLLRADPAAALRLATIQGKYRMLLRQIRVDEPGAELILDKGYQDLATYGGHHHLPPGYWVYVRPYWFIWRDKGDVRLPKRQWGTEQLTGPPDAAPGKDDPRAWASKLANNTGSEWVMVECQGPVKLTAIHIHETFNPGAVTRVSIFKPDGDEQVVWKSKKPGPTGKPSRVLKVEPPLGFEVARVKIYLDTSAVNGWNEIDAVALVDEKGNEHWAVAAMASTTWASSEGAVPVVPAPAALPLPVVRVPAVQPASPETRKLAKKVEELAAENAALKKRLEMLEKLVDELRRERRRER